MHRTKRLLGLAALLPAMSRADSPFNGVWVVQPELTTFEAQRLPSFMLERGDFRQEDCAKPIDLPADGADHPVKDPVVFDAMSVRALDRLRVEVIEKTAGRVTWKGLYTVARNLQSMTLAFENRRAAKPVSGVILYQREGSPLSGAHALSGTWRPDKLVELSASGSTLSIQDTDTGRILDWSDGRHISTELDVQFHPLDGYLEGASISVVHPRPDTLAINRKQGENPVEMVRAVLSEDGRTIAYKQVDYQCHSMVTFTYRKQGAP
jgi:hypothetical protein